jgi:hypothetical protein
VAVTPNYSIPYPALTDAPNAPAEMQALATQVDTSLLAVSGLATASGVAGTWVPTQGGLSNNAGSFYARYFLDGKLCTAFVRFAPNPTASLGTGTPTLTLPFTSTSALTGLMQGVGRLLDNSGTNRPLWVAVNPSATTAQLLGLNSSLQYVSPGNAGYTWGNSSLYDLTFTYETA